MSNEDEQWIQQLRSGLLYPDFIKKVFDNQRQFRSQQMSKIETHMKLKPKDDMTQAFGAVLKGNIENARLIMEYLESISLNVASLADAVIAIGKNVNMQETDLEKIKEKMPSLEWLHKFLERDARYTSDN